MKDIVNEYSTIRTDHIIWRLGRDVPRLPLIYGRLGKGIKIQFKGKIIQYKKYAGIDYSISLIKLINIER